MLMKKPLAAVGVAVGSGLLLLGAQKMFTKTQPLKAGAKPKAIKIPDYIKPLVNIIGEDVVVSIAKDPTWTELCDRAAEFYSLSVLEFKELCYAIADVVEFQLAVQEDKTKITLGTPRIFRTKLHAVVEAVRNYRAGIELKCSSALNDFDDIASDIQRAHDDAAYNILLESTRY